MKTFLKVAVTILVCLFLLLVVFRVTGFGPHGRIPGLWLSGTVVTAPVADWSFADKYPTLEIETRTRYLLPHSVTTSCMTFGGQLYVGSIYGPGIQYPHGRSWNENVARDPHVRIKIGNQLYDCTLVYVTDPSLIAAVLEAEQKKYPGFKVPTGGSLQLLHATATAGA